MLRIALTALAITLSSPAWADPCAYVSGDQRLYFVTPGLVAVANQNGKLPYACYAYSAGTGVDGRMLGCSDGYEGPLTYKSDYTITFRDAEWTDECPTDIGMGE